MGNSCINIGRQKPTTDPNYEQLLTDFIKKSCQSLLAEMYFRYKGRNFKTITFTINWDICEDYKIFINIDGILQFTFQIADYCLFCSIYPKMSQIPYTTYRKVLLQLDDSMISDNWYFTVSKKYATNLDSDFAWLDRENTDYINIDPKFCCNRLDNYLITTIPVNECKLTYYATKADKILAMENRIRKDLEISSKVNEKLKADLENLNNSTSH